MPGDGDGPRADDVAIGKRVVEAGIALYNGDPHWELLAASAMVRDAEVADTDEEGDARKSSCPPRRR